MECHEDDGKDDSRVLVNITASHAINCVGRVEDIGANLRVELRLTHGGHHGQVVMVAVVVGIMSVV